jgi:hypothetical protein
MMQPCTRCSWGSVFGAPTATAGPTRFRAELPALQARSQSLVRPPQTPSERRASPTPTVPPHRLSISFNDEKISRLALATFPRSGDFEGKGQRGERFRLDAGSVPHKATEPVRSPFTFHGTTTCDDTTKHHIHWMGYKDINDLGFFFPLHVARAREVLTHSHSWYSAQCRITDGSPRAQDSVRPFDGIDT